MAPRALEDPSFGLSFKDLFPQRREFLRFTGVSGGTGLRFGTGQERSRSFRVFSQGSPGSPRHESSE